MRRFNVSLAVVVVLVIGAIATMGWSTSAQEATPDPAATTAMATHPIVGAWQWTNSTGGAVASYSYAVFHDDGTYTEYDPGLGVGIGVWRPTGERTAELNVVFQDIDPDPEGFRPGWASWWILIEVDETGDAMTGEGKAQWRRPDGTVDGEFSFTGSGARLTVDTKTPLNMAMTGTPTP